MKKNVYSQDYTDIHELYAAVNMFIDESKKLKLSSNKDVVAYYDIKSDFGDMTMTLTTFIEVNG